MTELLAEDRQKLLSINCGTKMEVVEHPTGYKYEISLASNDLNVVQIGFKVVLMDP